MKIALIAGAASLALLIVSSAAAQQPPTSEKSYPQERVAAPENALELTVGTGYTQPFGQMRSGAGMPSVAGAGIGIDLGAGYRLDPHWGFAIGGQYSELTAEHVDAVRGFAATVAAQYHLDPNVRLDPWVELGTGYRLLWQVTPANAPNVMTHGFELARARVGLDLQVSEGVAIAPVIGADATLFLWQDAGTSSAISSPSVSTFVFAGLQGRMDVGGGTVGKASVTSAPIEPPTR